MIPVLPFVVVTTWELTFDGVNHEATRQSVATLADAYLEGRRLSCCRGALMVEVCEGDTVHCSYDRATNLWVNLTEEADAARRSMWPDGAWPNSLREQTEAVGLDCADSRAMSADRHNHITRDIKPFGECPACDKHWEPQQGSAVVYTSETGSLTERADCPDHGVGHDDCHQDCRACCGHECDDNCFSDDDGVDVSAEAAMVRLEAVIGRDDDHGRVGTTLSDEDALAVFFDGRPTDHDPQCPLSGKTVLLTVANWPTPSRVAAPYLVGAYGCRCALISEVTARCVGRAQQAVDTFIKAFDHKVDCECVGCESADLVVMAVAGYPIDGYFPEPYTRQAVR